MPGTRQNILEATNPRINAAVSASAGTGKTWLLVSRLLRLLLAGENPASILAITFTQKAAAEIRERLIATLRQWTQIDDASLDKELARTGAPKAQLKQARQLYENLLYAETDIHILTFHAFCTEILERFPFEANVSPGFEICEDETELHERALDQLYAEAAGKNPPPGLRAALQTLFRVFNGLTSTSRALDKFLQHRNDWFAYTEACKDPAHDATLRLSRALEIEAGDAEKDLVVDDEACGLFRAHQQFILHHRTATNEKYARRIDAFLGSDLTVDNEAWQPLLKCFFKEDGDLRITGYNSQVFRKALGTEYEPFKTNWQLSVKAVEDFQNLFLKRESLRRNRAWYIAGQCLVDIYQELKLAHRQLDFDDLEWSAYHLMNRKDDIRWIHARLHQRIRHILVDEFQDTNPQQWQLLKPLLEEMASQENSGSVFIVGDVKQSIYGFRRADPALQDQAQRWLQRHMRGRIYTADHSYRSAPEIIELVNRVFGDPDEPQSLEDFRPHHATLDIPGGVTVLPFTETSGKQNTTGNWRHILRDAPAGKADHPAREEGRMIARHIMQMFDERVAIYDHRGDHGDGHKPRTRPLRFGDICLLLRRRTHLDHYERAFLEAGIPHSSGRMEKLFGSLEIHDMASLLSFLLNNRRNLDLAQVLRSPIFSIDDKQLLTLSKKRNWFERLARMQNDEALRSAHSLLSGWIEMARIRAPAHDLLSTIYSEGDVVNRYRLGVSDQDRELVEKNLLDLLQYALEFESGRYPDLERFSRHLKRRIAWSRRTRSGTPSASGSEPDTGDRMRILTIHQAKGLEAPVVILADCGKSRPPAKAYSVLADWVEDSLRPRHFLLIPKSGDTDSLTQKRKQLLEQREARENKNLLYVALTRARQYLLVSGNGKEQGSWYETLARHAPEDKPRPRASDKEPDIKGTAEAVPPQATSQKPRQPLPPAYTSEINPSTLNKPSGTTQHVDSANPADVTARLRGHVIHCALQALTENKTTEAVRAILATRFPQARDCFGECVRSAQALIANESLRELFDTSLHEQVLNEAPITFSHEDEQYYGVIDRICVGKDTIWIVDYKTHHLPSERIEEIKATYTEQMRMYYCGISRLWPRHKIRVSLLLTESAQLCDYDFDRPG